MRLKAHELSLAGAIFFGLSMILFTVFSILGVYTGAVDQMQAVHLFYKPTFFGTIFGMIEAGITSYISIYIFVWIYNLITKK